MTAKDWVCCECGPCTSKNVVVYLGTTWTWENYSSYCLAASRQPQPDMCRGACHSRPYVNERVNTSIDALHEGATSSTHNSSRLARALRVWCYSPHEDIASLTPSSKGSQSMLPLPTNRHCCAISLSLLNIGSAFGTCLCLHKR